MLWRVFILLGAFGFSIEAAAPKIDPNTVDLLSRLTAQFRKAKTAETEFTITLQQTNALRQDPPNRYAIAVAKPNKIALTLKEGDVGASVFSDGTNVTAFVPMMNRYTIQPAPGQISLLVMQSAPALGDASGSMAFIAALFSADPFQSILSGVIEASDAGAELISTQRFQRLNFRQEELSWSLWMSTSAPPQLRRIEVDISNLGVEATKMTIDFAVWKFDAEIAPARFAFTPPKDARKVETFEIDSDSDLIGKKVPEFKLKSIDGAAWDSTKWKGQTSVLVFWSGTEEHTMKALTDLSELSGLHKNAKFYAINIDEKPDKAAIKQLLADKTINLPTAIDAANAITDEFEVDGVPMTFVIDKNGIVREAFLGYHADFKRLVEKEVR
jgi:peroxiredoxin